GDAPAHGGGADVAGAEARGGFRVDPRRGPRDGEGGRSGPLRPGRRRRGCGGRRGRRRLAPAVGPGGRARRRLGGEAGVGGAGGGERDLELVDVGAFDLVGTDQLDLIALLLVVEERVVELRLLDDALHLVLAERLGVLLALPRLDLPACLAVPGVDAGHAAENELFADQARALVLVDHPRLEAPSADEPAGAAQALDRLDPLRTADPLHVFRN